MSLALAESFFNRHPEVQGVLELFEYLPGIVFYAKDEHSRFVAANSTMLASKSLKDPSELLGKTDRDFHPPALAEAYIAEDQSIMQSGEALPNQPWVVLDGHGCPGWYRSSKTPLRLPDGRVIGIAGVRYSIQTPEDRVNQFQQLAEAILHLEQHYAEEISTETLARLAGLSITHFNRRFSEMFRMSPHRFLQALRIQRAQHLLATTTLAISEIAVQTGFYDQSHFTRSFRQVTGLTPRAYRQDWGGEVEG